MKRILLFFLATSSIFIGAQKVSESNFQSKSSEIEKAKTAEALSHLSRSLESPAADITQWQPAYYATYSVLRQAQLHLRNNDISAASESIQRAEQRLENIDHLIPANSEVTVLKAYLNILKISANTDGNTADFVKEAKKYLYLKQYVDHSNPRMELMRAQLNYVLGYHKAGKDLSSQFEKAGAAIKAFKPKNADDPTWGTTDVNYYKSKLNNKTAK